MNYFTGNDKKDKVFFMAILKELIEYKFGVSNESGEERTMKILKYFEQRHKELDLLRGNYVSEEKK